MVIWLLPAALGGCNGCSDHKPYTPFSLDGGVAVVSASSTSAPPVSSGSFTPIAAAPATGTSFPLEPGNVEAPAGKTFRAGLAIDADDDGAPDLLAWLDGDAANGGELWFVPGKDRTSGTTLAKLPAKLGNASCKRHVDLSQIGQATVLALVTAECAAGETKSYFAIARLHKGLAPDLRLDGTLGDAGPGESLSLRFSADDRDKDNNDDLSIEVTLDGLGDPFAAPGKVSLPVLFLDRPAGLARDASEPEATLARLGGGVIGKGKSAKLASGALVDGARALRLAAYVCDELGAPVMATSAGAVRCGDVGFVADSVFGVGLAALTRKDWGGALGALDVLSRLKLDPHKRGAELDKTLAKAIPKVEASTLHTIVAPVKRDGSLSPLTFDADGNLLVVSGDSVVRVAAQGFTEEASPVAPWPLDFAWHDADMDFHILGASRSCSPRGIAIDEKVGDSPTRALLPTIEAALPPKALPCTEGAVPLSPLLSGGGGVVLGVGSDTFKIESRGSGIQVTPSTPPDAKASPSLPGQSRAFDGSAIVLPVSGGVLVATEKGAKRWTSPDLQGAEKCVVKNGGARVACVTPRGAVLVEPR